MNGFRVTFLRALALVLAAACRSEKDIESAEVDVTPYGPRLMVVDVESAPHPAGATAIAARAARIELQMLHTPRDLWVLPGEDIQERLDSTALQVPADIGALRRLAYEMRAELAIGISSAPTPNGVHLASVLIYSRDSTSVVQLPAVVARQPFAAGVALARQLAGTTAWRVRP